MKNGSVLNQPKNQQKQNAISNDVLKKKLALWMH